MHNTDMTDGGSTIDDVSARLKVLRSWANVGSQKAFAELTGISPDEWNHFEAGRRMLSLTAANKIRLRWQVDLDWLYHGDRSGLSVEVSRALPTLADFQRQA
jgi:transcriptional regulator with XRE-family HTH domain